MKREKIGEWQENVYTRKNTGRTKETQFNQNQYLIHTVIPAII